MKYRLQFAPCVLALSGVHFLVTMLLIGFVAAGAMGRIPDHGTGPVTNPPISVAEQIGGTVVSVLLLPLLPLIGPLSAAGVTSLLPFLLNSLLWGAALSCLFHLRTRRGHKGNTIL